LLSGFGLATGSYLAALIMFASGVLVYARRINAEEAALLDAMGERYRVYCATRKKLIPFLYEPLLQPVVFGFRNRGASTNSYRPQWVRLPAIPISAPEELWRYSRHA
jgi:hypothetical protein